MRTLITGSSGFIGKRLRRRIVDSVGLDINPSGWTDIVKDARLCDPSTFDVVYHLAAFTNVRESIKQPQIYLSNNVETTERLVARTKGLFVLASSVGAEHPELSPYSQSKFLSEEIVKKNAKHYVILRFANVYGRGSKSVIQTFLGSSHIKVFGDGEQTRDYVYVDDIVDHMANITQVTPNSTYYVGTGVATSINELVSIISEYKYFQTIKYTDPILGEIVRPNIHADLVCATGLEEGIHRCIRGELRRG